MRAKSAEFEREETGALLVPMVHVERDIARMTTIVSFELPDEQLFRMTDRKKVRNALNRLAHRVAKAFLAEWDQRQKEKEWRRQWVEQG